VDGKDAVGPRCTSGETVAVRLTVPLKLFVPFTVIVKLVDDPLATDWEVGVRVIVKSAGGGGAETITETVTE